MNLRELRIVSASSSEERVNFPAHSFFHLDQRWPGAFEAFAGEFLRRVNAEFAAAGDFAAWPGTPAESRVRAIKRLSRRSILLSIVVVVIAWDLQLQLGWPVQPVYEKGVVVAFRHYYAAPLTAGAEFRYRLRPELEAPRATNGAGLR